MSKTTIVHRFLRAPSHASSKYSRIGNRSDPLANTLTVLKDPKHNRELYLIGTTNASTLLANRTKNLVRDLKPTYLVVQAEEQWWNVAKHINLTSQKDWNNVQADLSPVQHTTRNNFRGVWFKIKYWTWFKSLQYMANFPPDFQPFTPSMQIKYAIEQAKKAGSQVKFVGRDFTFESIAALRHSSFLFFFSLFWRTRYLRGRANTKNQLQDLRRTLQVRGGEAFAESIDKFRSNFMVYILDTIAPHQKRVLIDDRDDALFHQIYREAKGDKIVAVVNQWHVTGIEQRWRRLTGTELEVEESPVVDMDIDAVQERYLINEWLRDRASKVTKSEPATDRDYSTMYTKENYEVERTRHVAPRSEKEVPEHGEQPQIKHHH